MDKKFIGYTKNVQTKFGEIISIGLQQKDLDLLRDNLNESGYVNVVIKTSKTGSPYCEIDTYQPKTQQPQEEEIDIDEVPF